jgi:hypothetical protein
MSNPVGNHIEYMYNGGADTPVIIIDNEITDQKTSNLFPDLNILFPRSVISVSNFPQVGNIGIKVYFFNQTEHQPS